MLCPDSVRPELNCRTPTWHHRIGQCGENPSHLVSEVKVCGNSREETVGPPASTHIHLSVIIGNNFFLLNMKLGKAKG